MAGQQVRTDGTPFFNGIVKVTREDRSSTKTLRIGFYVPNAGFGRVHFKQIDKPKWRAKLATGQQNVEIMNRDACSWPNVATLLCLLHPFM